MKGPKDLYNDLDIVFSEVEAHMATIALKASFDAMALIRERVRTRQVDADGNPFPAYSQAKVPGHYFMGVPTSQSGSANANSNRRYIKAAQEASGSYFISYAGYRQARGLPNDKLNFTLTSSMWKSLDVTLRSDDDNGVVVSFVSDEQADQNGVTNEQKFKFHISRFDNLLHPNDEELGILRDIYLDQITNILDQQLS